MKRFVQTELFRTLWEASQKGIEVDAGVLKNRYDEFAEFLFSDGGVSADRTACYDALVYTHTELAALAEMSGKKSVGLL